MAQQVVTAAQAAASLPAAVIAAWIAAVAAAAAAIFSFFGSWFHQNRALRHDATQRDREREMALRRDVYVPAAEAITRAQGVLGQLSDLESKLPDLAAKLVDSLATISKVHLVASEDTVRCVMEYLNTFLPSYMELIGARKGLAVIKAQRDTASLETDKSAAAIDSYIQQMREFNISGNKDADFFMRLNHALMQERQAHARHAEHRAALCRQLVAEQTAIAERLAAILPRVAARIPDALLAARQELGLPIDPEEYRRLFRVQQEAAAQVMQRLVVELRRPLAENSTQAESEQQHRSGN